MVKKSPARPASKKTTAECRTATLNKKFAKVVPMDHNDAAKQIRSDLAALRKGATSEQKQMIDDIRKNVILICDYATKSKGLLTKMGNMLKVGR